MFHTPPQIVSIESFETMCAALVGFPSEQEPNRCGGDMNIHSAAGGYTSPLSASIAQQIPNPPEFPLDVTNEAHGVRLRAVTAWGLV